MAFALEFEEFELPEVELRLPLMLELIEMAAAELRDVGRLSISALKVFASTKDLLVGLLPPFGADKPEVKVVEDEVEDEDEEDREELEEEVEEVRRSRLFVPFDP